MNKIKAVEVEEQALEKRKVINKAILCGDSQVQKLYDNAVVFITGGSGFIGKQLVEKLLRSTNIRKMYILVRPKKGKSVQDRLKILLENPVFGVLREEKPSFHEKIEGIQGDVSEINLGIDEQNWAALTSEVNVILHAAATINLVEAMKTATLTNVRGTREMLKLARACKNIKSIVHVSTAYANATKNRINGEVKDDFYESPIPPDALIQLAESISEDDLNNMITPLMEQWPNSYTFTKQVTEDFIRSQATDLPICIVRPAIVISAYEEPSPGWVDPKNAFGPSGILVGISAGLTHTILVKKEKNIDLVPVDIVNNAIIAAAYKTNEKYNRGDKKITIYTVTRTRQPIKWEEIHDIVKTYKNDLLPSQSIWYCFCTETRYKFIHIILTWVLHYIPGLIIDGCSILLGKKPRIFKIYKLVSTLSSIFAYFINNDWIFRDANTLSLYNELSDTDKLIYNCEMSTLELDKTIWLWCYGIAKYIIKEDFSNLQYALKKQYWFRIAHYIIFPIYLYSLFKIGYFLFSILFYILTIIFV